MRQTLDAWYRRLPKYARSSIRSRFVDPSTAVHLGAFWELYVHELALRLGFDIDLDIGREDPERRRPDFLLTRDDCSVYVEATTVLGDDAVSPEQRSLVDALYDALERIDPGDFYLSVTPLRVGSSTPGRRSIGRRVEAWLKTLDADDVLARRDRDPPPEETFEFGDWSVRVQAHAWLPELRGRHGLRVVGPKTEGIGRVGDIQTFSEIQDIEPLTTKLRSKASRYGKLDHPYVIAVLCAGTFIEDNDVAQALIGPIVYTVPTGGPSAEGYQPGGLWYGINGLRNSRVDAVLIALSLRPAAAAAVEPTLWVGPQADDKLGSATPFRSFVFDATAAVTERPASQAVAEILRLSARWPAQDR